MTAAPSGRRSGGSSDQLSVTMPGLLLIGLIAEISAKTRHLVVEEPPAVGVLADDPERTSYGSFCSFSDPDGNTWLVQEVTTRLPARVDAAETAFASTADLARALLRAEAAHGEHQKRAGRSHLLHRSGQDENWPAWYAAYMVAEQAGTDLPA
jgi:hypothetical protein